MVVFSRSHARAWRAALLLLALLLLPLQPAQAAALQHPAAETVSYNLKITAEMKAAREGMPVCPGDEVTFIVRAWREGTSRDSHLDVPRTPAFGVPIDTLLPSTNVVHLTSAKRMMTSLDLDLPGAVEFTFKARKPGKAEVIFEALFPVRQVDAETRKSLSPADLNAVLYADVKTSVWVEECPIKISVVNQYLTDHGGLRQHIVTAFKQVPLMQADEEGNKFTYEGVEKVVITESIPECQVSWNGAERHIRVEATRVNKGFHITIERGPIEITVTHVCENGSNTNTIPIAGVGVQEWDVPLRGGWKSLRLVAPPTSFWWVINAEIAKKK